MKIQIYSQNFDLSPTLNQYIEDKFKSLSKYNLDIHDFQVKLFRDQHHKKGEVYTVEAKISLPNKEPLFVKEEASDPHEATDLVQEKLARLIVKNKNKRLAKLRSGIKKFRKLKFWRKKEY